MARGSGLGLGSGFFSPSTCTLLLLLLLACCCCWWRRCRCRRVCHDVSARKVCSRTPTPFHTPTGVVTRPLGLIPFCLVLLFILMLSPCSHEFRPSISRARPPRSEAFDLEVEDQPGGSVVTSGIIENHATRKKKEVGFAFAFFCASFENLRVCACFFFSFISIIRAIRLTHDSRQPAAGNNARMCVCVCVCVCMCVRVCLACFHVVLCALCRVDR